MNCCNHGFITSGNYSIDIADKLKQSGLSQGQCRETFRADSLHGNASIMLASIISMKWEFEHKGETFDILAIYQKHLKQLHFRWHHCYEGSLSINLELYQRCGTYVHKVTIPCISLISLQRRRKHVCTCFCLFHFCCKPRIMNHWLAQSTTLVREVFPSQCNLPTCSCNAALPEAVATSFLQ